MSTQDGHVNEGAPLVPENSHPSPSKYLIIAVILAIITGIEVALFYIEAVAPVLVPVLLILSATKFAMVAMFYMHLKFDEKLFSWFFVGGLVLASFVMVTLLALFGPLSDAVQRDAVVGLKTISSDSGTATIPLSGDQLFAAKGCGGCHSIDGVPGAVGTLGPDMNGIGARAETRVSTLSASEYIQQSIRAPSVFVVEGFDPIMPNLASSISQPEFDTLVSYLLSLE
jgi:cytochrome c oxidase subunit 4